VPQTAQRTNIRDGLKRQPDDEQRDAQVPASDVFGDRADITSATAYLLKALPSRLVSGLRSLADLERMTEIAGFAAKLPELNPNRHSAARCC